MVTFEYSDDYARKFGDVAEIKFSKRFFPDQCIRGWEYLIEEIEKGYNWESYELDYDVGHRETADFFLNENSLNNFPEHQEFKKLISELDTKFLNLTQVNPRLESFDELYWWEKRLLKYGGEKYREYLDEQELSMVKLKE